MFNVVHDHLCVLNVLIDLITITSYFYVTKTLLLFYVHTILFKRPPCEQRFGFIYKATFIDDSLSNPTPHSKHPLIHFTFFIFHKTIIKQID